MKKEVKINLELSEVVFLNEFFRHLINVPLPPKGNELEFYVAVEFYESKFKAFNIAKPRKMKLKASQAIALVRVLQLVDCDDDMLTKSYQMDLINRICKYFPELIKE